MPGPVSGSYDPEFGTGENSREIKEAIEKVVKRFTFLGEPKYILDVVREEYDSQAWNLRITEKEARIIRFCMNRAIESI